MRPQRLDLPIYVLWSKITKNVSFREYHSNGSELESLKKECKYVELHIYCCDLASPDSVNEMLNSIDDDGYYPSHILHLAAAKLNYSRIRKFDWQGYLVQMEIQVHSFIEILKCFLYDMQKQKYGRIVIMLTEYTLGVPPRFMSDYNMVKYSLLGLVKSLAAEYADKGITANGISPAMMETKVLSDIDDRVIQMNAENSPMKRNAAVEETVAGIEFLMSEQASYITGSNPMFPAEGICEFKYIAGGNCNYEYHFTYIYSVLLYICVDVLYCSV